MTREILRDVFPSLYSVLWAVLAALLVTAVWSWRAGAFVLAAEALRVLARPLGRVVGRGLFSLPMPLFGFALGAGILGLLQSQRALGVSVWPLMAALLGAEILTRIRMRMFVVASTQRQSGIPRSGTRMSSTVTAAYHYSFIEPRRITAGMARTVYAILVAYPLFGCLALPLPPALRLLGFLLTLRVTTQLFRGLVAAEITNAQRRRDRRAAACLDALRRGDGSCPPFALYCRPFWTTGRLAGASAQEFAEAGRSLETTRHTDIDGEEFVTQPTAAATLSLIETPYSESESMPEWESLLEAVVRPLTLVALGRPQEHAGAGRILTTDTSWQETFVMLATEARAFIVLPSLNAGTLWELQWLIGTRRLRGCVFVIPPIRTLPNAYIADWNALATQLEGQLMLPPLLTCPGMFAYDEQFRCHVALFDGIYPTSQAVAAAYRECLETATQPANAAFFPSMRWWATWPGGVGAWGEHRQGLNDFAEALAQRTHTPEMVVTTKVVDVPLGRPEKSTTDRK